MSQLDLFSQPSARVTDPRTSHAAARSVRPANDELVAAIRGYLTAHGPSTQEQIGRALCGDRWLYGTVVTACARARLVNVREVLVKKPKKPARRVVLWYVAP